LDNTGKVKLLTDVNINTETDRTSSVAILHTVSIDINNMVYFGENEITC